MTVAPTAPRILIVRGRGSPEPVDALDDHSRLLAEALRNLGAEARLLAVDPTGTGAPAALRRIRRAARDVDGVLIQHTHLMWSRRGFPGWVVPAVATARSAGRPVAVLFHDPNPFGGTRLVDRIRSRFQTASGRAAARIADATLVSIAPDRTPFPGGRLCVTPPNILPPADRCRPPRREDGTIRIALFALTGGEQGRKEIDTVDRAIRSVQRHRRLQLVAFGHGVTEHAGSLSRVCADVQAHGILEPAEISRHLHSVDFALFVRGPISSRRGTAAALIAHGLPVVAWEGAETAPPLTEAGILTAPVGDVDTFARHAAALVRDPQLRHRLGERSRAAYERWFTWDRCARTVLVALGLDRCGS